MVLEGAVKYLVAIVILFLSTALAWVVSAKYLEPMILRVFNPGTYEKYLDIWFSTFVFIELVVLLGYLIYVCKVHKANKNRKNG